MENRFIDRLFGEIAKQGINKTKFYSDIDISRTTILNWKRGSIPGTDTFLKICKYLNVSPYYLWFGEEDEVIKKDIQEKIKKYNAIKRIVEN